MLVIIDHLLVLRQLFGVSVPGVALLIMQESVSPDVGVSLLHASESVVPVCTSAEVNYHRWCSGASRERPSVIVA